MRLILVRHGLSEWNAVGRLQGTSDPALVHAGREQARALGPLVAALRPDAALSSGLRRASETLELLGLPLDPLPPDPRWREADLGEWTARLPGELTAEEHAALLRWRVGKATPPGGESWAATCERVTEAARALAASGHRRVLVVTHGGAIRACCDALCHLDPESMTPVGNATVTVIETSPVPHLLALGMRPPGA
ncbi:MAG: histidine phosphatase family protein [Thermoleophilia bacterium]